MKKAMQNKIMGVMDDITLAKIHAKRLPKIFPETSKMLEKVEQKAIAETCKVIKEDPESQKTFEELNKLFKKTRKG